MHKLYNWVKSEWGALILIVVLGAVLRFVFLDKYPPSLNWDEVSHGYNAFSILKTGNDEWGNKLPLIFQAYGDYKLPLYIYLSTPFVAIFGLNSISIRLLSFLAGSLLPIIIFLVIKKVIPKHPHVAIIASLVSAFSPSTIFLSRIALEANLFVLIFFISTYFLIDKKYGLSSFFYALSIFTYNSSRVILPFYLILLFFLIVKNNYQFKTNWYKFLFLFITLIIFIFQSFQNIGQARYKWVTLLDQGAVNQINELRMRYPRFLVNKVTYFTYNATKNYISHLNPNYLFIKGGSHYQFNLPNFYLVSPFFIPFLIIGLYNFFVSIRKKSFYSFMIVLFCLLVAPIPSAITRDAPHILRSIVLIPTAIIMISFAFINLKRWKLYLSLIFTVLILIISQIQFWKQYINYSKEYSSLWQYGYKEVVDFVKINYDNYDKIIVTKKYGEPHEYFLYYLKYDPTEYLKDTNRIAFNQSNWYWVDRFDKFNFVNDWQIPKSSSEFVLESKKTVDCSLPYVHCLLITSPNNYPNGWERVDAVDFLDGKPAFEMYENY